MNTLRFSLRQIGVITGLTFREAWRRRLMWIGLGLGAVFLALFAVGFYFAWQDFTAHETRYIELFASIFMMAGLYVVNFLVVMVTVLTTVGSVSAEVQSNTIHAIAAKPIRRWEIVLGKWLGHAIMLAIYTTVLAGGIMLVTFFISGHFPDNALAGIGVLILESLAVLSMTMLGSTALSTLANGVVVFMLYGVGFVGGWVEQIGSLLQSRTAVDIGIASSLLMPGEGLWRYAAGLMQVRVPFNAPVTPFSVISQPSQAFVIYALIYTLVLLGAAMWSFSQRDF